MRIMTILGTRPEIIRLSRVIPRLDEIADHVLVHTGQNNDPNLNDVFFQSLPVRQPNYRFEARGSAARQWATLFPACEDLLLRIKPDKLLILGDTNSALCALIAKRHGIAVYHMEAGNRCFDDRVPEEVNRRVVDHCSDVLLPYTERARANLIREGIASNRIFVTGNPIWEVIRYKDEQIAQSNVVQRLGLKPKSYFLVTAHRAENVDVEGRLAAMLTAFDRLQREHRLPVIVSTHPRTRARLGELSGIAVNSEVRFLEPFDFCDFVALERQAACVLTDSGTVQEECALLSVPNVTIRDVTERPETMECGSNVVAGIEPDSVARGVRQALASSRQITPPPEYRVEHVSHTVVNILLSRIPQ
jgi:UDP-N-acetylglucosamine 2-epimerase (non-hydrolysing)